MNIHVTTVSQCSGGNHRIFAVTINGAAATITVDRSDMVLDKVDRGAVEDAVVERIRSALKEASAGAGLAAWKTVLEGKDFQV